MQRHSARQQCQDDPHSSQHTCTGLEVRRDLLKHLLLGVELCLSLPFTPASASQPSAHTLDVHMLVAEESAEVVSSQAGWLKSNSCCALMLDSSWAGLRTLRRTHDLRRCSLLLAAKGPPDHGQHCWHRAPACKSRIEMCILACLSNAWPQDSTKSLRYSQTLERTGCIAPGAGITGGALCTAGCFMHAGQMRTMPYETTSRIFWGFMLHTTRTRRSCRASIGTNLTRPLTICTQHLISCPSTAMICMALGGLTCPCCKLAVPDAELALPS